MGRLVSLASEPTSSASSQLQHEPMDQRPAYQTTTACHAPLITLTTLQPIAATFAGSAQGRHGCGCYRRSDADRRLLVPPSRLLACPLFAAAPGRPVLPRRASPPRVWWQPQRGGGGGC
ncbi:hypothetical protein MTO96_002054 [Rhipicephalus appendiculatus]